MRPYEPAGHMNKIFIGLGNPIISDDAVGHRVADLIERRVPDAITRRQVICLELLDEMDGTDEAVFIDAMRTGEYPPGTVVRIEEDRIAHLRNVTAPHSLNLPAIMEMGRGLGYRMPARIRYYGIEARDLETFSERMTDELEAALPAIVERILVWEAEGE